MLDKIFILFQFVWKMGTHISAYLQPGFFYSVSTTLGWNEQDSEACGKSRVVGTQFLPRIGTYSNDNIRTDGQRQS